MSYEPATLTRVFGALLAASTLIPTSAPAWASEGSIAMPRVRGPKKARPKTLGRVMRGVFEDAGYTLIDKKALVAAARIVDAAASSSEAAAEAGADLLVTASVKRRKKRYVLTVRLIDPENGEVLTKESKRFKGRKAGKRTARQLARKLLPLAAELMAEKFEPEPPPPVVVAPEPEPEPELEPEVEATPDPGTEQVAEVTPAEAKAPPIVEISVSSGTQVGTAYTVSVADEVTALAYRLSPLALINIGARVNIPDTGLGIELLANIAPVKYSLDTEPAVTPADPSGVFANVGLLLAYDIPLLTFGESGALSLEPVVGEVVEMLNGTGEQMPHSIIVESMAVTTHVGVRPKLKFGDAFDIALDARLRIVAAYIENPNTTGDGGFGIGAWVGGKARYFVTDLFGISAELGYEYTQVGMSGEGNRAKFVGDPPLVNATVFSSAFRVALGLTLAI